MSLHVRTYLFKCPDISGHVSALLPLYFRPAFLGFPVNHAGLRGFRILAVTDHSMIKKTSNHVSF